MITVSEYAKAIDITPQAAYKRIEKEPYSKYVYRMGKRTFLDRDIIKLEEAAAEEPKEETNNAAAEEPTEQNNVNPSAEVEEMQQRIEELTAEIKELKAENKELYLKIVSLTSDIQKTNSELLEIIKNSLQLTQNSQVLLGYDKAAAAEEPQEPKQRNNGSEEKKPQPLKAIKNIISIFR